MNNWYAPSRRGIPKPALVVICCVLLIILVLLCVVAFQLNHHDDPSETNPVQNAGPLPELIIHSVEEQADVMNVETSYGSFSYPFAFSDIITIEAINAEDRVGLAFNAYMNGSFEPMYNLWLNSQIGTPAGTLHVAGESYAVFVEIQEPRADLDEAYLPTFYAAQETLNDVLQSMEANGSFEYSIE